MKKNRLVTLLVRIILASFLLSTPMAFASMKIVIDSSWRFCIDPHNVGESQGWMRTIPQDTEEVSLPNTWNVGKNVNYQGTAWYFKTLRIDPSLIGHYIEVHFGATFYQAHVYLNGQMIGSHEGGYSAYSFDISKQLRAVNLLAVEVSNKPGMFTVPGAPLKDDPTGVIYDWWPYGGLTRDVWLTVGYPTLIRWQHIDSTVMQGVAKIEDRVRIENHTSQTKKFILTTEVFSEEGGNPLASATQRVSISPGIEYTELKLELPHPRLWNLDQPYLYSVKTTLRRDSGAYVDSVSDSIGVRTVLIRDRRLYINGQQVRLSGLDRHEDSPWEGSAETRGTMLYDYNDMKALGETLTRPVHYQQNPFIYNYADRNGILMIPEVPMWQFNQMQMENPHAIAMARQQLTDLINQNYNHPSIFAWSMDNESATDTPGGIAYFKMMYALAKKLDPNRYVSFADDRIAFVKNPKDNASSIADFVMWNEYFGTWDAPASQLPATIERLGKAYPDKMFLITEFGTPGIYATSPAAADRLRIQTMRDQMKLFAAQPWIAGAILWCYQDYHSEHNLRPGQDGSYVDHGVVTAYRQRKPSYYVWKSLNTPATIDTLWSFSAKEEPIGFTATIKRRPLTELPSYPLDHYILVWRLLDESGKTIAQSQQTLGLIGQPEQATGHWPSPDKHTYLRLEISLYRPTGFLALRKNLTWRVPELYSNNGMDSPEY